MRCSKEPSGGGGHTGNEALATIPLERPDLVIHQLLMPERDGLQISMVPRQAGRETPILAVSGGGPFLAVDPLPFVRRLGACVTMAGPLNETPCLRPLTLPFFKRV